MYSISHHEKVWGYEKWIVNNDLYCGKILFLIKDKRSSFHYHYTKHETFYLQSGKVLVKYCNSDNIDLCKSIILNSGDKFEIEPLLRHQILALEDSELFEFSTTHSEEDRCRISI